MFSIFDFKTVMAVSFSQSAYAYLFFAPSFMHTYTLVQGEAAKL
jgi:hypothetical protein